jgi:hypothetical protein
MSVGENRRQKDEGRRMKHGAAGRLSLPSAFILHTSAFSCKEMTDDQ